VGKLKEKEKRANEEKEKGKIIAKLGKYVDKAPVLTVQISRGGKYHLQIKGGVPFWAKNRPLLH
jgi:hypothetical protein